MSDNITIEIMIFDGNPNGLIMSDLGMSSCRAYKVSRNEIHQLYNREDSENAGVYFLFGKNDENEDTVYIGESENIYTRLKQNLKSKDYWYDYIAVISKDKTLNKAHVKYLEHAFYSLAKESGRAIISQNKPTCSSLSEYDETKLKKFINHARLLVNTLGFKVFDSIDETTATINNMKILFFIKAARGANAKGMVVTDGFVVLKDSKIANTTTPSMTDNLIRHRKSLYEKGIIDKKHSFVRDHVFTSPSLAASIVMGRNANGLTEWKTDDRKTIKEIEDGI